jgi:uncharacterized membrane protein YqjE
VLDALRARLAELGAQLRDDLRRAALLAFACAGAMIFGALALVLFSAAIMIAAWESYRLEAALLLASVFAALAGLAGWSVRRLQQAQAAPSSLATVDGMVSIARWVAGGIVLYSIARRVSRALGRGHGA